MDPLTRISAYGRFRIKFKRQAPRLFRVTRSKVSIVLSKSRKRTEGRSSLNAFPFLYQRNFNTYKYKRLLFGVVLKTAIGPKATFSRQGSFPSIYFHRRVNLSDKSTRPGVSKSTCKTQTRQSNGCRTCRAIFIGTLAEFPNLIDQSKTRLSLSN